MSAIKITIFISFLNILIVSCLESKLLDKATDTVNKMFHYRAITCVVWRRTDPEDVNRLLERFHGSVVTFDMKETMNTDFHKLVKYKQTVLFARDPDEFRRFIYLVVRHLINPISVILILTEPVLNNKILSDMMQLAWGNDVGDFIILSVDGENGNVTLTTYIPYRDGECGNCSPVILTDDDSKHFVRKFKDFKRCPIRITAVPLVLYFELETEGGKVRIGGLDGDLLTLVMDRLNATMYVKDGINFEIGEVINGSVTGALGDLVNGLADVMLPTGYLTEKKYFIAQTSYVYGKSIVWCMPQRREIYTYLKVLSPFFTSITTFLIIAFVSLIVLIMFIQKFGLAKPKLRNVIFRLYSVFIGAPIKFVQKNWLVNSIFVLWIWFCLIIRVVYLSDLMESFELKIFEPRVRTVSEALETVDGHGGSPTVKEYFVNTSVEINYQAVKFNETKYYINEVSNGKRFLLATNVMFIKYFNPAVQILDERVITTPSCFYMRPRWPATKEVDKIVQRIAETGFVIKFIRDHLKKRSVKSLTWKKSPKPLGLSVLIASFYGLTIMYIVCAIVLALEMYCYKIQRRR